MIEATDSLWIISEICKAQRSIGLNSVQAWVLSSYAALGMPTLKGFNADTHLTSQKFYADFTGKAFLDAVPILKKANYDKCFPIKGEIWFWIADGLLMLSAEYNKEGA